MRISPLKRYFPSSLYGRAALIIVVPMVALLALLTFAFAQRHFEDTTLQMTSSVTRELRTIFSGVQTAADRQTALLDVFPLANTLSYDLRFVERQSVPERDRFIWYDYTGRIMSHALRGEMPPVLGIDLSDDKRPLVYLDTRHGVLEIGFERWRITPSTPHQFLVIVLSFGLLMIAITYVFMRRQLRPMTRLAQAAEAFGKGQVLPYRPAGAQEVRAAGKAFLDMRDRIERYVEQRTFILSGVSHDLRTPLTRLRLGLEMIPGDDSDALLEDIREMERLINNFLDFSRDMGEDRSELLDPQDFIRQVVEDAQRAGKSVTLIDSQAKDPIPLQPLLIRRAVGNLIENASRYANTAQVSVFCASQFLTIRVEDDGPGIPLQLRKEALKPFGRLDLARNQNKGNAAGLGLSIAADVARAHGGSLILGESVRLGGLQADISIALLSIPATKAASPSAKPPK